MGPCKKKYIDREMTNVQLVQDLLQHTEYRSAGTLLKNAFQSGIEKINSTTDYLKKEQDHRSRESTLKKIVDEIADAFAKKMNLTVNDLHKYTQNMKFLKANKEVFFSGDNKRFTTLQDEVVNLQSSLGKLVLVLHEINTTSCDNFETLKSLHEAYENTKKTQSALSAITKKEVNDMTKTLTNLFEIREKGTPPKEEDMRQKIEKATVKNIVDILKSAKTAYPDPNEKYTFIYNSLKFAKEFEATPEHITKVSNYLETTDVITFLSKIYDIPNHCSTEAYESTK